MTDIQAFEANVLANNGIWKGQSNQTSPIYDDSPIRREFFDSSTSPTDPSLSNQQIIVVIKLYISMRISENSPKESIKLDKLQVPSFNLEFTR